MMETQTTRLNKSLALTALAALLIAILLFTTGCDAGKPVVFNGPEAGDFSKLGWVDAFDSMHEKMSKEYAFTEWRGIDWEQKKDEFRPLIEKAGAANDQRSYYRALREYLFSIPDGHVALITGKSFNDDGLGTCREEIGGGFGMTVARLDDGRLIVNWVKEGGPASSAGIKASSEIVAWDGKPAETALRETSTLWSILPQATDAGRDYERMRFMVRAPVGTSRQVTFKNPGDALATISLIAVDDGMETLTMTDAYGGAFSGIPPEKVVESRWLEAGIGYIKVYGEGDKAGQAPTVEQFREMVSAFAASNASGLIIDIRGNTGGADAMSAALLGSFYDERTLYEYQNWYNSDNGKMEIVLPDEITGEVTRGAGLYIEPAQARFKGPVIALVNSGCISSGEGIALGIKNLPNGKVVGLRGTNGSFGMVMGPVINMPGGYSIIYPVGQSLDKNKRIQIDSRGGIGGVTPTDKVPVTLKNMLRSASGVDVELEFALEVIAGNKTPGNDR